MGAGIDIFTPHGSLVVDIGGGTTDMAVVSLGGVSTMRSVKLAGTHFDEAIIKYMRRKYNLIIGQKTAEKREDRHWLRVSQGGAFLLCHEGPQRSFRASPSGDGILG